MSSPPRKFPADMWTAVDRQCNLNILNHQAQKFLGSYDVTQNSEQRKFREEVYIRNWKPILSRLENDIFPTLVHNSIQNK